MPATPPAPPSKQKDLGKLNLPHGNSESAATEISDVQSAHALLGPSDIWWILIVLRNGQSFFVDYSNENVAYLNGLGIKVCYPAGKPDPNPPKLGQP